MAQVRVHVFDTDLINYYGKVVVLDRRLALSLQEQGKVKLIAPKRNRKRKSIKKKTKKYSWLREQPDRQKALEYLRRFQIHWNIGDIWKVNSILNIGAYEQRFHFADDLRDSGAVVDVLEIDKERCKWVQSLDWVSNVYCGNVIHINKICKEKYDLIFWSHGPALLYRTAVAPTIKKLERLAKMVVILTPYGRYIYGLTSNLSQIDLNKSSLYPRDFEALGFNTHKIGRVDGGSTTSLLAWKECR